MTIGTTIFCLITIPATLYLSILLFPSLPLSGQCMLYENSLAMIPYISNRVQYDGSLACLNDFKESCQILEMDQWAAEHPFPTPAPEPDEEGEFGHSVEFQDQGDGTSIVFVGNKHEAAVFRYYPGLLKIERLDDTIASICPALPWHPAMAWTKPTLL